MKSRTRGVALGLLVGHLLAGSLVTEARAQARFEVMPTVEIPHNYDSWSLFLICNPAWLAPQRRRGHSSALRAVQGVRRGHRSEEPRDLVLEEAGGGSHGGADRRQPQQRLLPAVQAAAEQRPARSGHHPASRCAGGRRLLLRQPQWPGRARQRRCPRQADRSAAGHRSEPGRARGQRPLAADAQRRRWLSSAAPDHSSIRCPSPSTPDSSRPRSRTRRPDATR